MNFNTVFVKTIHILLILLFSFSFINCSDNDEELYLSIEPEENSTGETLRLISYNIWEGMKVDRPNNYNNFVKWVKGYDPDILAFQEANTWTQEILESLAARYDHPYVVTNIKIGDNYPVALTSKYPIEVRRKITKDVSHGAIFARIKGVNVVVTHLWPQPYWHEKDDGKGDEYRLQEINIVLDNTIRQYPSESKWIFCGDFNSRSTKDYLKGKEGDYSFEVHNTIEKAGYTDVMHYMYGYKKAGLESYPGRYPGNRIDFIYGTNAFLRNLTHSEFIDDDFTILNKYSDHPPMLIDFRN